MKNNNKAFFDSYFRRIMYGDMYLITRIISGIVTRMETVSETRVLPSKNDAARVPNHFLGVHKRYAARTEVTEINIFL
jgi:hypothetical protein